MNVIFLGICEKGIIRRNFNELNEFFCCSTEKLKNKCCCADSFRYFFNTSMTLQYLSRIPREDKCHINIFPIITILIQKQESL